MPAPRKRRVIKPLSKIPTPQVKQGTESNESVRSVGAAARVEAEAAVAAAMEAAAAAAVAAAAAAAASEVAAAAAVDAASAPAPGSAEAFFSQAHNVRGYQSARHSSEKAHERINGQLAGLQRKKIIRARARGESVHVEPEKKKAAREASAARFYGGVGLQLEESTPERFVRLAKLAKEWRQGPYTMYRAPYTSVYPIPYTLCTQTLCPKPRTPYPSS